MGGDHHTTAVRPPVPHLPDADAAENPREVLRRYMQRHGLKSTAQRQAVVEAFLDTEGHVTLDQLHGLVNEANASVGYTTVYRTMKLLTDCGVAQARSFGEGVTLFEVAQHHHDHLICVSCGLIVEFEENRIEALQEEVAEGHGFTLTSHKMELYGHCPNCQRKRKRGRD